MLQKQIEHSVLGPILYTKRVGCKTLRVLISRQKGIRVSLPFYTSYSTAVAFVDNHLDKICQILKKQQQKEQTGSGESALAKYTPGELKEIRKRAHEILPQKVASLSMWLTANFEIKNSFGIKVKEPFKYGRVAIKNNRSNWGSCSSKNNINLNMHLVSLPEELCHFVIIHELCHLVYHNHSAQFHQLVNAACKGREKEYARELKRYRLQ